MGYPYPKFCICAFLGPIASPRGPDFETENPVGGRQNYGPFFGSLILYGTYY